MKFVISTNYILYDWHRILITTFLEIFIETSFINYLIYLYFNYQVCSDGFKSLGPRGPGLGRQIFSGTKISKGAKFEIVRKNLHCMCCVYISTVETYLSYLEKFKFIGYPKNFVKNLYHNKQSDLLSNKFLFHRWRSWNYMKSHFNFWEYSNFPRNFPILSFLKTLFRLSPTFVKKIKIGSLVLKDAVTNKQQIAFNFYWCM